MPAPAPETGDPGGMFLIQDPRVGFDSISGHEDRLRPPVPPKTLPRPPHQNGVAPASDNCNAKRPKLSLSLRGVLETDLDSSLAPGDPPPESSCAPGLSRQLSRSPERKISQDISAKVSKFEALAQSQTEQSYRDQERKDSSKSLWFYRDGLRTPTTPNPTSRLTGGEEMAPVTSVMPGPCHEADNVMTRSLSSLSASSLQMSAPVSEAPVLPTKTRAPAPLSDLAPVTRLPPPLPPKQTRSASPPPRPLSKELRLEDILLLCAEYEKQIEAEKLEAMSLSPSPQVRPSPGPSEPEVTRSRDTTPKPEPLAPPSLVSSFTCPLSPLSPGSPTSTLQPPRIKTNGSLPRDGKRLPSPARSLPPNSPLVANLENENGGIFHFDGARMLPGSPILSGCGGRGLNYSLGADPGLTSLPSHCSSPRTRIRTTLVTVPPGTPGPDISKLNSSCQGDASHLSCDLQGGGGEGLADAGDKTREQLYSEAKEILALVPGPSPSESPCNTGPRRPPRSKHDKDKDESLLNTSSEAVMPSSEAASRMLIGTVMLSKGSATQSPASVDTLKRERDAVLEEVNRTAKELSELSIAIEEAERSVDMERSLIGAEVSGRQQEMIDLETLLEELREKERSLGGQLGEKKKKNLSEIDKARVRLEAAEKALDDLENKQNENMNTDEEMELLEQIKKSHELLEAERRVFEDLEFRQMEEEAVLEAAMEDVSREINETQESRVAAESSMSEMEHEKLEMSVNQDISIMQEKRDSVGRKLEEEKEKLVDLEFKLRQMLVASRGERTSEDSGTITWSEAEQEETVKTEAKKNVWVENNILASPSLRSSTSDLGATPSPQSVRGRPGLSDGATPQQRAGIPTPKHCPMTMSAIDCLVPISNGGYSAMEDSLVMSDCSRPVSVGSALWSGDVTDTSSWVGGPVTRRGEGGRSSRLGAGQRPLTRYLPVTTQQDFDLRGHIETAGHQIELCRHIVLNSCSCRGYLHKMGARMKTWSKRWFVFDRNKRTLVYYADKSETKVKGGIYFHSIMEVYVDHQTSKSVSQRVTFCMKTQDRKYYLMAPSPEAMRIWVDVLFTGAEGYQEFQD